MTGNMEAKLSESDTFIYGKIIVYPPKFTAFFNSNTKVSIFAIHPPIVSFFFSI